MLSWGMSKRGTLHQRTSGARERAQIIVFYDGHCSFCRRTAAWIRRIDILAGVTVSSFRHEESYRQYGVALPALEGEMHVVADSVIYKGFDAVQLLARRMPLLWPFVPLFWLLAQAGLGDRLYRLLADNRVVVADGTTCRLAADCAQADA